MLMAMTRLGCGLLTKARCDRLEDLLATECAEPPARLSREELARLFRTELYGRAA